MYANELAHARNEKVRVIYSQHGTRILHYADGTIDRTGVTAKCGSFDHFKWQEVVRNGCELSSIQRAFDVVESRDDRNRPAPSISVFKQPVVKESTAASVNAAPSAVDAPPQRVDAVGVTVPVKVDTAELKHLPVSCKYGKDCKHLSLGFCKFSHPKGDVVGPAVVIRKGTSNWHSVCLSDKIEISPGVEPIRDSVIATLGTQHFTKVSNWEEYVEHQHSVDGEVIRRFNRRLALSMLISLVTPHLQGKNPRVLDLCGSVKSANYVARINSRVASKDRVFYTVHRTFECAKDVARNSLHGVIDIVHPKPDEFSEYVTTPIEELDLYLTKSYFDCVFIQDVQQRVASRGAIYEMVKKGLIVCLVFHIERGPFGSSGHSGFFFRTPECVVNYPHLQSGMVPYNDHDDMSWIYDEVYCEMSWNYEITAYNTGVAWFSLQRNPNPTVKAVGLPEVGLEKFLYNNYDRAWFKWIKDIIIGVGFGDPWSDIGGYREGDSIELPVHYAIANEHGFARIDRTIEKTSSRGLAIAVSDSLSKLRWANFMRNSYPMDYEKLVAGTIAYASRIVNNVMVPCTTIQRSDHSRVQAVYDNQSFMRQSLPLKSRGSPWFITLGCLPLGVLCVYKPHVVIAAMAAINRQLVKKPIVLIALGATVASWTVHLQVSNAVFTGVFSHLRRLLPPMRMVSFTFITAMRLHARFEGVKTVRKISHPVVTVHEHFIEGVDVKDVTPSAAHVWTPANGLKFTNVEYFEFDPTDRVTLVGPYDKDVTYLRKSAINMSSLFNDLVAPSTVSYARQAQSINRYLSKGTDLLSRKYETTARLTDTELSEWADSKTDKSKLYHDNLALLDERREDDAVLPGRVHCDGMIKRTEPMLKAKVRNITVPGTKFTVSTGAYLDRAMANLKTEWQTDLTYHKIVCPEFNDLAAASVPEKINFRPIYGGGIGPVELTRLMEETLLNTEADSYTAIVSGDDGGLVVNKSWSSGHYVVEQRFVVETDASSFDRTEGYGAIGLEMRYLEALGVPEFTLKALERMLGAPTMLINPENRSEWVKVDLSKSPRRRSGGTDTSIGNTIVMMNLLKMLALYINKLWSEKYPVENITSEDFKEKIKTFFEDFGIKIKVKIHIDVYQFSFLKGFLVPRRDGSHIWAPSFAKILRMGVFDVDPAVMKCYDNVPSIWGTCHPYLKRCHMMADVLNGYKYYGNMPLISALRRAYQGYGTGTKYRNSFQSIELSQTVDDLDWSHVYQFYGIEAHQVRDLEMILEAHRPGIFIDHYVFERISVDYR
jgi:hypothetical protein